MLQLYARVGNVGVRRFQLHRSIEKHGILMQSQRNKSGKASSNSSENKFKTEFSIGDEVLNGRPLYLDAQATNPLVCILVFYSCAIQRRKFFLKISHGHINGFFWVFAIVRIHEY